MSDRQMPSIFPECDKLKQIYDKCFTEFFQKFISPNYRHQHAVNPCERLHQVYRECVDERLTSDRPFEVDLNEIRKDYIDSEDDKFKNQ